MAANKIYTVVKDGEELEKLKTLSAAKKLADTEGAEVYCDGECVYRGAVEDAVKESVTETVSATSPETASEKSETPAAEENKVQEAQTVQTAQKTQKGTAQYRLTSLMNVRKAPSLDAEKAGTKDAGAVVDVAAVENDWLHLADGSYILYAGGKYAEKI